MTRWLTPTNIEDTGETQAIASNEELESHAHLRQNLLLLRWNRNQHHHNR
jgi:hypothetical protein